MPSKIDIIKFGKAMAKIGYNLGEVPDISLILDNEGMEQTIWDVWEKELYKK